MSKGITYYKLKSHYDGDYTKNCGLDGYEIDNNFFTLEGRDIKSVDVEDDSLVINLINGETITSNNAFCDFTKDITFSFDELNGVLTVVRNGETQEISGFSTSYTTNETVATDGTVIGNGKAEKPIGISPMYKTGMYRPVKKVLYSDKCQKLPTPDKLVPGDRYVTCENVSNYGFLYNYDGVTKIASDLAECNSPWRVPTKEDWDNMLNAIEPCSSDRNHSSSSGNKYLGKFAGKLLKSKFLWKLEGGCPDTSDCACTCIDYSDCDNTPCSQIYGGEAGSAKYPPILYPNRGVDKYGFSINPAGYADDGAQYGYFLERAWYWTASNKQLSNVYTKRFEYNKSTVYQDIISTNQYLSLRLVKDFDGNNYNEREDILGGTYSTIIMPSQNNGSAIWTSSNIALSNKCYGPMLPNDGMGMTTISKYFINEWDGKRWLRNEMREGESVVVLDAPNGNRNIEYRIVKGDLVNVAISTYEDVLHTITPVIDSIKCQLNAEVERATTKENEIDTNLNAEVERAKLKENEIEDALNVEVERATTKETELDGRIDTTNATVSTINQTLADFGTETAKAFEQINNVIETSINTINGAILAEVTNRENSDKELSDKIDEEAKNREAADNEIIKKITTEKVDVVALIEAEKNERVAADQELSNTITANKELLDSTIARLDAEIENRTAADQVLQANIDKVSHDLSDISDKVSTLEEKETSDYNEIKAALETETASREVADAGLDNAIKTEAADRELADAALDNQIKTEISDRKAADEEVVKMIHVSEGSSFDSELGVLTLKSNGGENDIQIQFSLNFGDI